MKLEMNFTSKVTNSNVNISIYYPKPSEKSVNVVWLFPGLGADKEDVIKSRQIRNQAKINNLMLIAVDGYRSFYQNMEHGYNYYDLISQEITQKVKETFSVEFISERIIGVSMGGYGAFYHCLQQPGRFKEIISISGSVHIVKRDEAKRKNNDFIAKEWQLIFGDKLKSEKDLFKYPAKKYPKVILSCGQDDHLYEHNLEYYEHLKNIGVDVYLDVKPGAHDYDYFIPEIINQLSKIKEK